MVIPGRELLERLVLVAGHALRGDAEVTGAGSVQSHWGLHPGADDRSSEEVGRAHGARRNTEDRQRRHVGANYGTGVNGGEVVRGESMGGGKGERSVVLAGWILRVVWCLCLRCQWAGLSHHPMWPVDRKRFSVIGRAGCGRQNAMDDRCVCAYLRDV